MEKNKINNQKQNSNKKNEDNNKIYMKNLNRKKEDLEKFSNIKTVNDENKGVRIIVYVASILLLLILFTFIFIKSKQKREEKVRFGKEGQEELEKEINSLYYMKEDKRARKYLAQIIKNIKDEKYDEEYFKLYQEYKDNFFPTLRDYEIYIKENFPKSPVTKYKNFEIIGDLFILFVDIVDLDNPEKSLKDMKFVFKEDDVNKYIYSFSIKTQKDKQEKYITPPNEIEFPNESAEITVPREKEEFDLLEKLREMEEAKEQERSNEERVEEEKENDLEEQRVEDINKN